jgi:PAS domain-containing protein
MTAAAAQSAADAPGAHHDSAHRHCAVAQNNSSPIAVFDHLSDGIFITDARLRIVAVNSAFSTLTGFRRRRCWEGGPG